MTLRLNVRKKTLIITSGEKDEDISSSSKAEAQWKYREIDTVKKWRRKTRRIL
jgi:hypothetical protein